jgi:hypothetical protein
MVPKKRVAGTCLALAFVATMPATAFAQSGIAGVVKDATGAVLPGVTVEASSPVLIEKVRAVATDGQGQYKVVDLRPGTYAVVFSLPGFNTVKREGIELTASFTATVNVELRVGALEETVTVSGESPMVDVHNVVQQQVVTAEAIATVPTARTYQNFGQLIPGATINSTIRPSPQDVGGLSGERQRLMLHGGRANDFSHTVDGQSGFNVLNSAGSTTGVTINPGEVQEFSYELGAISAETEKGGVHVNIVPRDGGNRFAGSLFGAFANSSMQADNLTDDLRARGLTSGNPLNQLSDINPAFGGPLLDNKLWFFGSVRQNVLNLGVAGVYENATPTAFSYKPDLNRPATDDFKMRSAGVRFTWQATPKHKLALYALRGGQCQCHIGIAGNRAPEATAAGRHPINQIVNVTWSATFSNRLLLQSGALVNRFISAMEPQPGLTPDTIAVTELSTGQAFRAASSYNFTRHRIQAYRTALTYVTGSHAFKAGMTLMQGQRSARVTVNGDLNLQLLNGVPRSITVYATPYVNTEDLNANFGLYVQDQWTVKHLTVNAGLRFDALHASVPEQHLSAVRLMPARDFAAVPDVPKWHDLSPRLGASYDLFGNGKTALKGSVSRYVVGELVDFAQGNNPVISSVNSTTRTWTDLNGNFYPDCNLTNPATNAECGPLTNANFGKPNIVTRYDDAIRTGFGVRAYNWETTAGIQQQLTGGLSAGATYFRRWYGNFNVTDNLSVTPQNYDTYCITAPKDARLPDGGGYRVCGLYDINPSRFGQISNLVSPASSYGKQTEIFNGVDLTVAARVKRGAFVQGGVSIGRLETNNCFVVDSPQQLRFCNVKPPFQSSIKFMGAYPLPWDMQIGGSFQSTPGPQITASYAATSTLIQPSLGRNLSSGPNGTAAIELIEPGTMYGARMYQVDTRLTKIIRLGSKRIQGNFDMYNALNASPVLVQNNTFGSAWQRPNYILPGRLFKVSAQVDF